VGVGVVWVTTVISGNAVEEKARRREEVQLLAAVGRKLIRSLQKGCRMYPRCAANEREEINGCRWEA